MSREYRITQSIHIDAPRARVWQALLNPEGLRALLPEGSAVIPEDPAAKQDVVGTTWTVKGRGEIIVVTVTESDPPARYATRSQLSRAQGWGETRLEERDGGTLLVISEGLAWTRGGVRVFFERLMFPLIAGPLVRRGMKKLKGLVESGAL